MAGFDPAGDASRRRVLAPCVSGRSGDRRHRHDRTGTHAGWRSAQREIAPAQLAGRRQPVVPMFCVPAAGMNPRPCRSRRRQYDAGARERQRRTGSARTGCSVPLSRSELAIDRQRIVGREDVPPSDCRARRMFTLRRRVAEGATVFLQVRTRRRREKPPGWRSRRPHGHRQQGKPAAPSLSGYAPTRRRCWPASARRPPPSWPRSARPAGMRRACRARGRRLPRGGWPGCAPAPATTAATRRPPAGRHGPGKALSRNPAGLTRGRPR